MGKSIDHHKGHKVEDKLSPSTRDKLRVSATNQIRWKSMRWNSDR